MFDPECYVDTRRRRKAWLEKTYCQCSACIAMGLLFGLVTAAVTALVLL